MRMNNEIVEISEIGKIPICFLFDELHMSPSQKQKFFTFSRIFIFLQPFAVLIPIALAFISSSLVKHLLLAGVSILYLK